MEEGSPLTLRILNAEPLGYSDEARKALRRLGEVVERPVLQDELTEAVRGFEVLVVRLGLRVTKEVVRAADGLRVIVTPTTGLDHIDLEAAEERGVTVISLHGEADFLRTIPASAEHTWALLLALVRRVPWAFWHVRQGGWNRDSFRGRDLSCRRLGILGLGRVGEKVARFGRAFEMDVGAYDPYKVEWAEGVTRRVSLDELLATSDVLSVHVPLNSETQGMLDDERLRLLPRGAWVVNTARGGILDEHALVRLLEEGHIAGAAVDVLAVEHPHERREKSPLLTYARDHDNLLVTPHLAGATIESMEETEVFVAQKLRRFLVDERVPE